MSRDDASYGIVAVRRGQFDSLMWQAPVLSLTAQAFLFTIALGPGSSRLARAVSALLAFLTAGMSMLLMAKHRLREVYDSEWLEAYEREHGLPVIHGHDEFRAFEAQRWRRPFRVSLYKVWLAGLAGFGMTAFGVAIVAVVAPGLLATGR